MNIKLTLTRDSNAKFFDVDTDSTIEIDLESYVRGVVASEIGNAHPEACAAQAICARTRAIYLYSKNKSISDSSSSNQAFRAERMDNNSYSNARIGTDNTTGLILLYNNKPLDTCVFSANNAGHTTSSLERWGGAREYLPSQPDPYDNAAKRTGHGVGMSQLGAKNMAERGFTYSEILNFYFPHTTICTWEGDSMSKKIQVQDLIAQFQTMYNQHWSYEWGAARKGRVDCSGAFVYAFKTLGGPSMPHSSNAIPRQKCGPILPISQAQPGYAALKWRTQTDPALIQKYGKDDYYHIGLVDNSGKNVLNAKGTAYGFSLDPLDKWQYVCKLNDVVYSGGATPMPTDKVLFTATVNASPYLRIRASASTNSAKIGEVPNGKEVNVLQDGDWAYIEYNGIYGYVSSDYLIKNQPQPGTNEPETGEVQITLPANVAIELYEALVNAIKD